MGGFPADLGWCILGRVIAKEKWHCSLPPLHVRLAVAVLPPALALKNVFDLLPRGHVSAIPEPKQKHASYSMFFISWREIALPRTLWRGTTTETWQMQKGSKRFYRHYFCNFLWRWNDIRSTGFWVLGDFVLSSRSWVFASLGEGETVAESAGVGPPCRWPQRKLSKTICRVSVLMQLLKDPAGVLPEPRTNFPTVTRS